MSAVLAFTAQLEAHTCPACSMMFAAPHRFVAERRVDGQSFFCPAGHPMGFHETEVDRLKKQLEEQKRATAWAEQGRDSWQRTAKSAERSLSATKGVVTRTKNRISKGVCPCCKRSFQDLRRHMGTKHPDYAKQETKGAGHGDS